MGTTAGVTANHHTAEAPSPLIFLDTEFVETDCGVRFISVGLVTGAGSEFYSELPLSEAEELLAQHPNDFVRSEVLPQLGLVEGAPWSDLPKRLAAWLDSLGAREAQVIYDFNIDFLLVEQVLAQLASPLAVRLIPGHVGYLLDDVDGSNAAAACWQAVAAVKGISRHHALADAYSLRARFEAVHRPVLHIEPQTVELYATVTVVIEIEGFELVHAETADGRTLSIGELVEGVDWRSLSVGQRLRCIAVIGNATRVLSAEVV